MIARIRDLDSQGEFAVVQAGRLRPLDPPLVAPIVVSEFRTVCVKPKGRIYSGEVFGATT